MRKIITSFILIATFVSCNKDNGQVCYECIDQSGNEIGYPCGANKAEARTKLTGTYNGINYATATEAEFDRVCKRK